MSVVRFGNDKLMVALNGDAMEFTTDPHPMGGNDYVEAIWNITNFNKSGAGTLTATLTVEGSNDGTTWFDTTLTDSQTSLPSVPIQEGGFVRAAFIRFKYKLELAGGSIGDIGYIAFDVHANLLKSGS